MPARIWQAVELEAAIVMQIYSESACESSKMAPLLQVALHREESAERAEVLEKVPPHLPVDCEALGKGLTSPPFSNNSDHVFCPK